jgi:hypothetical protein
MAKSRGDWADEAFTIVTLRDGRDLAIQNGVGKRDITRVTCEKPAEVKFCRIAACKLLMSNFIGVLLVFGHVSAVLGLKSGCCRRGVQGPQAD